MSTSYVGLFRSAGRHGWRVSFPDLPGCEAEGDSFNEAVSAATEAIAEHLQEMDGPPPTPRTALELMAASQWDAALKRQLPYAVLHPVPAPPDAGDLAPAELVAMNSQGAGPGRNAHG